LARNVRRDLLPVEGDTFSRMLSTIRAKARRNKLRTSYHDSKKTLDKIGFSIPPHMQDFQTVIGWADKAVSVPSRRIRPEGFTLPGRSSGLLQEAAAIMEANHAATVERMAIRSSLQHSVAFVFTTKGEPDLDEPEVVITARTALEATAEIDPRSGKVTAALEIIGTSEFLMYLPGKVMKIELGNYAYQVTREYTTPTRRVMCQPYVWGKTLERPFGYSRISRPLMGYIDGGVRTMLRQEVNAEFYGAPQRALLGAEKEHFIDENGKRISPLDALIGGVWALPYTRDDETGDLLKPTLQQLTQASFQPHGEMLRLIASQVSSETSIPVSYLGVIHDNPASADAIRATEADLISVVEDELPAIADSRCELLRNVASVQQGEWTPAMDKELKGLTSYFRDPGTITKAEQADATVKYVTAFPNGDPEVAMELYGLTRQQIARNMAHMKKMNAQQSLTALLGNPTQTEPTGERPALEAQAV
jgi:hypothetical protein